MGNPHAFTDAEEAEGRLKAGAPPPPTGAFGKAKAGAVQAVQHVWGYISYGLNCEWLALPRWPSLILLVVLTVGLSLAVGLSASHIKDGVTLGVEFGGGYTMMYACVPWENSTVEVSTETVTAQAETIFKDLEEFGLPNSVVTVLKPNKIQITIPGITDSNEIEPVLAKFSSLPLDMEIRSAMSMSGTMGNQDLIKTIEAAGVAMCIVWAMLIFRYGVAGVLGLFLCVVYIWLHMIFFNASHYALSDAAIVAVVLNIGLGADAHIIAFERVREDMHPLPRGAPRELGLKALNHGLRVALITVMEANVSTLLAMVVLYGVGTGATVEFAFTVIISVCASIVVNVLLARVFMRLAWNAELMSTGGFFGDKGPAYDEERHEWYKKVNRYLLIPELKPRRNVIGIDFVKFWWIGFIATAVVVVAGSVFLGTKGLNWGVDYSAGTSVSMIIPPPYDYDCADVTKYAERRSNSTVSRCSIASEGHVELRFKDALDPKSLQIVIYRLTGVLGGPIVYNEYTIDSTLAVDQSRRAIVAMVVSAVVTCAFLLLRFGPGFATSGFVSLASAGIFAICCFAMGGYEVNLPIIAAILTVFSYAINDCVVVFDRIRYEMSALPEPPRYPRELRRTVNRAMGLVTIRSLLTLIVVMVCSICLVGLGPQGLESFSLAITFGLLNATYTTLLLCVPFWFVMRRVPLVYQLKKSGQWPPPAEELTSNGSSSSGKLGSTSFSSFKRMFKDSSISSKESSPVNTPAPASA